VPSVNINESTGRIQYTATSGQTVFVYDFVIFTEADLVVIQEGATLTYLTDYTITGVGNGTGGTVTLTVGATVGDTVTIYRDTTIARSSQYNPDGRFDAAPLERDFDKITTILQELKRDSNRTVKLAADDPLDSLTLPTDRENKFLSFDANGSPIATVGSTSAGTPFGATGISLAAADTKATALSVLGILADNQTFAGDLILNGSASFKGKTLFQDDGSRTISSGVITALGSYHTIDTQSAAASDDLDTVSTTGSGLFVMWRAEDDARTVVVKHNTGNIFVPTALDISLDTTNRVIGTLYDSELAKHIVLFDGTTKEYVDNEDTKLKAQFLHIQDQKAANTQGGTATSGSFQTRTLNTAVTNTITGASLGSNQITLPAGTYYMETECPAYAVLQHKAILYNVTDAANVLIGTSGYAASTDNGHDQSFVKGRFTIAGTKVLEIRHRVNTTNTDDGFGIASNFGVNEVYTDVRIWKVS